MSWIILIVIGAIIGWLASILMRTDQEQGLILNVIVGILGSVVVRYIFYDLLHVGSAAGAGSLTFWGILWGVIGAMILIAILRGLRILH